jgi:hypothetical protein
MILGFPASRTVGQINFYSLIICWVSSFVVATEHKLKYPIWEETLPRAGSSSRAEVK